jgi:Zn-dependent membrane protease YugP/Flp pilus assembly protein TadD
MLDQMTDVFDALGDGHVYLLLFLLLFVPALLLGHWIRRRYSLAVRQYLQHPAACRLPGVEVAKRLLEHAGIRGVAVTPSHGLWRSNHYHPISREIALSHAVYGGHSLAAIGIAAHEVGHAAQHADGARLVRFRFLLVSMTNICFCLGLLALGFGVVENSDSLPWIGLALFAGCVVFPIVNLPMEFDASARASSMIRDAGLAEPQERSAVEKVLRAAALTYVATAVQSTMALLVLTVFVLLRHRMSTGFFTGGEGSIWLVAGIQGVAIVWLVCRRKRKPLRAAPTAAEINNSGNLLTAQGEIAKAIAAYSQAIRVDPRLVVAYVNRGRAYSLIGRLDDALADLNNAIRLCPTSAEAYGFRGSVRRCRKEYDAALADYDEAVRLAGDRLPTLRVNRGDVWADRGDLDRAIQVYTEGMEHPESRSDALCSRGLAWMLKGDLERALTDLEESVRLDPSSAIAYNNRGVALMRRGEFARAREDLQTAIRLLPQHPNAYKNLALLQGTCPDPSFRDGAQAVNNAKRAQQLSGDNDLAWLDVLAAAHAEAGNFEAAVRCQERHLAQTSPDQQADQHARLELYRSGQAFRSAWGGPPASQDPESRPEARPTELTLNV